MSDFIIERCNKKFGFLNKPFELFGYGIPDFGLGLVGGRLTILSGGERYFVKNATCIVAHIYGIRFAAPARACFGYFDNMITVEGQDVSETIMKFLKEVGGYS